MKHSLIPHSMCLRKEAFTTKQEAQESIDYIMEAAREVKSTQRNTLRAYRCNFCSKWHIGNRS